MSIKPTLIQARLADKQIQTGMVPVVPRDPRTLLGLYREQLFHSNALSVLRNVFVAAPALRYAAWGKLDTVRGHDALLRESKSVKSQREL